MIGIRKKLAFLVALAMMLTMAMPVVFAAVDGGASTVDALSTPAQPAQTKEFTFEVTVVDDVLGDPVSGLLIGAFSFAEVLTLGGGAANGTLTIVSVVEAGTTGVYTVTATYDEAESIDITVTADGIEITSGDVTVDVQVLSVDGAASAVDAASTPAQPAQTKEFTFEVTLVDDDDGSEVSGLLEGAFSFAEALTAGGVANGTLTIVSVVEAGTTGVYTVTATYDEAESIDITVTADGIEITSGDVTVDVQVLSVDGAVSTVDAVSTPAQPLRNVEFTFEVTLVDDDDGSPVSGLLIGAFSFAEALTAGGVANGTLTIVSVVEAGTTGVYTVTATYDEAESIDITVTADGVEITSGDVTVDVEVVDTTAYDAIVASLPANNDDETYTADSWAAYLIAIGDCDLTLTEAAGQAALDAEVIAIQAALDLLVEAVDTTAYDAIVASLPANNDDETYTSDSWTAYLAAIADCDLTLTEAAGQAALDAEVIAIQAAIDLLEEVVDTTAYDAIVASLPANNNDETYTADSWTAYLAAIADCDLTLTEAAGQAALDAEVIAIQAALDLLVVVVNHVANITQSNVLLVGDYAFELSDASYTLNNFLLAAQTVYESSEAQYHIYYHVGEGVWYDLVTDPELENPIVDLNTINGGGLYQYFNMVDITL
ncbi:UNVERIFIED_CONTAM: FctA-like pili component [Acetivibrio alkalicellulosi]